MSSFIWYTYPMTLPEKNGSENFDQERFERNLEELRNAPFTDTYHFIAGTLVSQLLNPESQIHFTRNDIDIYIRFIEQVEASELNREVKKMITETLWHVISLHFSQEDIQATSGLLQQQHGNLEGLEKSLIALTGTPTEVVRNLADIEQTEKEKLWQYYPKNIQQVLKDYIAKDNNNRPHETKIPLLENVEIRVADANADPLEPISYTAPPAVIYLPYNWKLNIELLRNMYSAPVQQIADMYECQPKEVPDEMLLVYYFTHALGNAVVDIANNKRFESLTYRKIPKKRQKQTNEKLVQNFTLNYLLTHKIDFREYIELPVNIDKGENGWTKFERLLSKFSQQDKSKIYEVYDYVYKQHIKQRIRKSGEPYFMHPREMAIMALKEGITDVILITAILLHDVPEDTISPIVIPIEERKRVDTVDRNLAFRFIANQFGEPELAPILYDLSEEPLTEVELKHLKKELGREPTEEEKHERKEKIYYAKWDVYQDLNGRSILVKIDDRLHNFMTLDAVSEKKQAAKVQETENIFMRAFKDFLRLQNSDDVDKYEKEFKRVRKSLLQQLLSQIALRRMIFKANGNEIPTGKLRSYHTF